MVKRSVLTGNKFKDIGLVTLVVAALSSVVASVVTGGAGEIQRQFIVIAPGVSSAPGIREASPAPWYGPGAGSAAAVQPFAPPAHVYEIPDRGVSAAPSRCVDGGFEVLNPDKGEGRCAGGPSR